MVSAYIEPDLQKSQVKHEGKFEEPETNDWLKEVVFRRAYWVNSFFKLLVNGCTNCWHLIFMNFADIEKIEAWKYYSNAWFLWKPTRVLCCHGICTSKLSVFSAIFSVDCLTDSGSAVLSNLWKLPSLIH